MRDFKQPTGKLWWWLAIGTLDPNVGDGAYDQGEKSLRFLNWRDCRNSRIIGFLWKNNIYFQMVEVIEIQDIN